jgi:hypothetical protein
VTSPFNPADAAARSALLALEEKALAKLTEAHASVDMSAVLRAVNAIRPLVEYVGRLEQDLDEARDRHSDCGLWVTAMMGARDEALARLAVGALLAFVQWARGEAEREEQKEATAQLNVMWYEAAEARRRERDEARAERDAALLENERLRAALGNAADVLDDIGYTKTAGEVRAVLSPQAKEGK